MKTSWTDHHLRQKYHSCSHHHHHHIKQMNQQEEQFEMPCLGVSSLQRQIIPSTTNPRVPRRSALHPPPRCQDLQASQHPATPAFLFLAS
ncbi:unnamed protein product [Pleuronectes platessa]|uniref:Uncharacterized protein n=1 Tax=Pleuronectes platessa TaxID=8262 RepID=A0A9N7Z1J7_PLEPL|nr:unnamed protein product [Pleuronectes platessa]